MNLLHTVYVGVKCTSQQLDVQAENHTLHARNKITLQIMNKTVVILLKSGTTNLFAIDFSPNCMKI